MAARARFDYAAGVSRGDMGTPLRRYRGAAAVVVVGLGASRPSALLAILLDTWHTCSPTMQAAAVASSGQV